MKQKFNTKKRIIIPSRFFYNLDGNQLKEFNENSGLKLTSSRFLSKAKSRVCYFKVINAQKYFLCKIKYEFETI